MAQDHFKLSGFAKQRIADADAVAVSVGLPTYTELACALAALRKTNYSAPARRLAEHELGRLQFDPYAEGRPKTQSYTAHYEAHRKSLGA